MHLSSLRSKSPSAADLPRDSIRQGPSPLVKISPITSPTHPAHAQSGLFAARDLKPGTFLLEYLGVIHAPPQPPPPQEQQQEKNHGDDAAHADPPVDPHSGSDYDLSLDRHAGLAIDAAAGGNETRFINDYRGVAERPNAEFRKVWVSARGEQGMGVWVLPVGKSGKGRAGIRRGQEILVSYGRGFWGARRDEGFG